MSQVTSQLVQVSEMIRAFVAHFEDALQSCRSATRRWKKFVRARVVAPGMEFQRWQLKLEVVSC